MKKLLILAASAILAVTTQAAAVGWSLGGGNTAYKGDSYLFFVLGQNGADSIATVTALLDAGTSVDSYAFGSGVIADNGNVNVSAANSGKTLDAGSYTSFMVVFDSAVPQPGDKYVVVSGATTQTKTIAATTASVAFAAGNASSILNNASNWKSYGAVPEPTSGLLMLLGMAGLALRRKRA